MSPAPIFDFTDRATPIVQFGRTAHVMKGEARWGRALWDGESLWGDNSWEPVWTDVTCDIHQVTTDTGRNSAADRFAPATAQIVASNINQLSDMIFPELPPPIPFEPLPTEFDEVVGFDAPTLLVDAPLSKVGEWGGIGESEGFSMHTPGVHAGDVLFVCIACDLPGTSSLRRAVPAGFTVIDTLGDNDTSGATGPAVWSVAVWSRRVLSEDQADPHFPVLMDEIGAFNWCAVALRGIGTTILDGPVGWWQGNFTSGTGLRVETPDNGRTSPPGTADCMVVRFFCTLKSHIWSGEPAGTHVWKRVVSGSEWTWDTHLALDGTSSAPALVPTGAVGSKSQSLTGFTGPNEQNMGLTLIVRPGPYTPPPSPAPHLEEAGLMVRIGVDHAEFGECWLFRGFVDGMVPTYVPDREDAVVIECIDALGEAGRVRIPEAFTVPAYAEAPRRIHQILNLVSWPKPLRNIADDSTVMSPFSGGQRAVDALAQVAESCGGAVYGGLLNGDVVFKAQDWQGAGIAQGVQGVISNVRPDDPESDIPRVCPTGWELSWRRSDSTTRAYFTADNDGTVKGWRAVLSEKYFGIEDYRTTLLCITGERLNELAIRHLRIKSVRVFPRVEAALLDASTADSALDLMSIATFTRPSVFRCQLHRNEVDVFNYLNIVVGVRHTISPEQWTCRLALHRAAAFVEQGGRWGVSRWGRTTWGRTH